jgi:hypothetical protein
MLSVGAHTQASSTKNILTILKSTDIVAVRLDHTSEIVTKDRVARLAKAERYPEGQPKPAHGKLETAHLAVCFRGFDSAHADQNLVRGWLGLLDVYHMENIRAAILFVNYRLHLVLSNRFFTLYNKAIVYKL